MPVASLYGDLLHLAAPASKAPAMSPPHASPRGYDYNGNGSPGAGPFESVGREFESLRAHHKIKHFHGIPASPKFVCVPGDSGYFFRRLPIYDYGTVATENRLSKCSGRPLGLCGRRLPELNLIPIQVIDPGKATVGFIHSFGVNLYSLLF